MDNINNQILWQSKSGTVIITDPNNVANPHYQISRPKTKEPEPDIWIDRNERVLEALIKKLETCYIDRNKNNFRLVSKDGKFRISFRIWLWEQYHGKKVSKHAKIDVADGDIHNLMSYNLASTRDDCPNNDVRAIYRYGDGDYLHMNFKKYIDGVFILDYDPELYDVLCDRRLRWTYNTKKGIAQAEYIYYSDTTKRSMKNITISQIVIGFYYYGLRKKNILDVLRKMRKSFNSKKLVVDHLDSDKKNNCKYNLSVMPSKLNSSKSDITFNILTPYYLFAAYDGCKYKVHCGIENEDSKYYLIENAENLIAFLKMFYTSELGDTTPKEIYTVNPSGKCLSHYYITKFSKEADAQKDTYSIKDDHKELAERPDEKFTVFRKDDVL